MKLSELIKQVGDVEIDLDKLLMPDVYVPEEPILKKIDLSLCIESEIECEFTDQDTFNSYTHIGTLTEIDLTANYPYSSVISIEDTHTDIHKLCRPRFNHTHANPDGWDKCPVPKGFSISCWEPDESGMLYCYTKTEQMEWNRQTVMFEVTGIAEGWEL